jgi:hypothetical protein
MFEFKFWRSAPYLQLVEMSFVIVVGVEPGTLPDILFGVESLGDESILCFGLPEVLGHPLWR